MAETSCRECSIAVVASAAACPDCGFPFVEEPPGGPPGQRLAEPSAAVMAPDGSEPSKTEESGSVIVLKLVGYWTILAIVFSQVDWGGAGRHGGSSLTGRPRLKGKAGMVQLLFDESNPRHDARSPSGFRTTVGLSSSIGATAKGDPKRTSIAWRNVADALSRPANRWDVHDNDALRSQSIARYLSRIQQLAEADLAALRSVTPSAPVSSPIPLQDLRLTLEAMKAPNAQGVDVELTRFVAALTNDVERLLDNSRAMSAELGPADSFSSIRGLFEAAGAPESAAAQSFSPRLLDLTREHARLLQQLTVSMNRVAALRESLAKRYPGESFSAP